EQEHSLSRPVFEAPGARLPDADIRIDFLVDVHERRRNIDALANAEGEAVGLAGAVVGILTENHHLHVAVIRQREGAEDVRRRGEDRMLRTLLLQEADEVAYIRFSKLLAKHFSPSRRGFAALPLGRDGRHRQSSERRSASTSIA